MFDQVIEKLNISKDKMKKEYDKNTRVYDYDVGNKVWLKVKHYKSGETRNLSPRRTGPWTVLQKLPNGVNFEIKNDITREKKIVHHDRMFPAKVKEIETDASGDLIPVPRKRNNPVRTTNYSSESESEYSDYDIGTGVGGDIPAGDERRYPHRLRTQREIPGAVPWDQVDLHCVV